MPDAPASDTRADGPSSEETRAALLRAEAELRRLRGDFDALLGLVRNDCARFMEANDKLTAASAAFLDQLAKRDRLIAEQQGSIRALNLALAQERARRLQPKSGRPGGDGQWRRAR